MAQTERAPDMLERALEYLEFGYPIFPVCSPLMGYHEHWSKEEARYIACPPDKRGKNPMTPWKALQTSLPTPTMVRSWWRRWPTANIGMATGELSGQVVLDCDSGEARQLAMEKGGLDKTPAVFTGKPGGVHYWLKHPGVAVSNFARKLPGLDFRGDGGYVLLPPSAHASGARYRWVDGTAGTKPAEVPAWLMAMLTGAGGDGDTDTEHEPLDLDLILNGIPEGHRNDTLWRYACKMRGDGVDRAYAETLIRQAARLCKPAYDEGEAVAMLKRAYNTYGVNNPPAFTHIPKPAAQAAAQPVAEVAQGSFLRPISELLEMPEVEPDWLVQDLFTAGSSGWVGAEPKVGKSWITLELAYALSTGTPFLGKFNAPHRRRVAYIQEEDSIQRVLRRFKKLLRGTPGRRPPSDDYLRWSVRAGFKIDNPAWIESLRGDLTEFPAEVVILDVFNRLHLRNENNQDEMSSLLEILIGLTKEFGCAFIVVHHNKKAQPGSESRPNQMLRGSGVLAGWSECSLYLRKGKGKNVFIVFPESKDTSEMDEFAVTLKDTEDNGVVLELGDVAIGDRLADMQAKIVKAIDALAKEGLDATTLRIADKVKADRSTVSRYLKDLVESGIVGDDEVKIGKTVAKIYFSTSHE